MHLTSFKNSFKLSLLLTFISKFFPHFPYEIALYFYFHVYFFFLFWLLYLELDIPIAYLNVANLVQLGISVRFKFSDRSQNLFTFLSLFWIKDGRSTHLLKDCYSQLIAKAKADVTNSI